ncbi:MAG: alpha/beta hydrolase family protein [Candidatus Ratteibacteria bacterium]
MYRGIFDYQKTDEFHVTLIRKATNYDVFLVKFRSGRPTGLEICDKVSGFYYRIHNCRKVIIVIHGLSMIFMTKCLCRYLAKKGFSSFLLVMPYAPARISKKRPITRLPQDLDWPEIFKNGLIQAVVDVRKAIDFLEKENEKIGILGISLGATIANLVHLIDLRISSGIYIVGGGDLANMLWDSRDFIARIYKRKLFGLIDKQTLISRWKSIDPLTYARKLNNVLMINAKYDTSVKPVYTLKLWESIGKPEIYWLRCAHFFLTHIFFVRKLILSHFRKTLL